MLNTLTDWYPVVAAALAPAGAVFAHLRWIRPRWRRWRADFVAARDSIIGRDAIRDSITGREIEPALPGVGVRLNGLEESLAKLAAGLTSLADSHVRLEDHEERIKRLEIASVERIVARSESARAWAAMEAAALASPDEVVEPD